MEPRKFKYLVLITGGLGPDVWDKEIEIEAEDIMEAALMAVAGAREINGWVVCIEQDS